MNARASAAGRAPAIVATDVGERSVRIALGSVAPTIVRCPEAEAWAGSCISVPCFPELAEDEVDQVAGALAELAGG